MSPVMTIAWRDIRSYFASPKGAAIFFFFLGERKAGHIDYDRTRQQRVGHVGDH